MVAQQRLSSSAVVQARLIRDANFICEKRELGQELFVRRLEKAAELEPA
jgi:hypothetical protein